MKITDPRFKYIPSVSTNITSTWKRFGFKPTTEAERLARQRRDYPGDEMPDEVDSGASITKLDLTKRKNRPWRVAEK